MGGTGLHVHYLHISGMGGRHAVMMHLHISSHGHHPVHLLHLFEVIQLGKGAQRLPFPMAQPQEEDPEVSSAVARNSKALPDSGTSKMTS